MSSRSISELIAELEKSVTAIPRVAHTIAHALRSKLLGEVEQVSAVPATGSEPSEALEPAPRTQVKEPNLGAEDLPETYGRTRLVILVVDPRKVHAYWEVTPDKLAAAQTATGSPGLPPAVLRFHGDEGGVSPADSFDVPVNLQSRNWYVNLWSPDKSYYAELGLKSDTGQFAPLARSNVVRTPREWPVIQVEEHFMRVDEVQQRAEPVSPPTFVRPHRDRPIIPADQPISLSHGSGQEPSNEPGYWPSQESSHWPIDEPSHQTSHAPDLSQSLSNEQSHEPATQSPVAAQPPREVRPPGRINSEEIVKEKLAELYDIRVMSRRPLRVPQVLPAPAPGHNLSGLAERRFIMGIFSHAPGKTADKV